MLNFSVFDNGKAAKEFALRNAYLIGSDGSAMRANITFVDGAIACDKREAGSAALALQRPVGDCGELTLQTCLLPDRDEPYLLNVELARHRLMSVYNKSEDWGMFDIEPGHPVSRRVDLARKLFIEALCLQNEHPAKADQAAHKSLVAAIDGSEQLHGPTAVLACDLRKPAIIHSFYEILDLQPYVIDHGVHGLEEIRVFLHIFLEQKLGLNQTAGPVPGG